MNRKERRNQKREGGMVTLHQPPEEVDKALLALLFSQLAHAYETGCKLPGLSFPIHVVVESGGKRACGSIEPGDGPAAVVRAEGEA